MATQQSDFLTIAEAADALGVAPNTLRSWGAAGKVEEYRHPINNYRLYKKQDVAELVTVLRNPPRVGAKRKGKRTKRAK